MIPASSFSSTYNYLLRELYDSGVWELNTRTGVEILTVPGGHSFKLKLSAGRLPVPGNRRFYPKVAAVETAWQFMATQNPAWIVARAPKLWSNFVEDGKLKTAYGYRWSEHFGRDQLEMAVDALSKDNSNRQIWVQAWDPAADGLGAPDQPKNIPCPIGFSVSVADDKAHMSVFIRSSDVFVGLPYDVMSYTLTLDAIAATLGKAPGTIHFTLAHPHLYETHNEYFEHSLRNKPWPAQAVEPSLPGWSIPEIRKDPDGYINLVGRLAKRLGAHEYAPLPELIL